MTDDQNEILAGSIKPDGGLFNLGWYLRWHVKSKEATLDGDFSAEDLEAIATHMRQNYKARP